MEAKEAKEAKETVADIVAEKRDRANEIERDVAEKMASGKMVSDQYAREVIAELRKEADRLDAAWKRETQTYLDQIRDAMNQFGHEKFKSEHAPVGNTAAMREACVNIVEYARSARCHTDDAHVLGFLDQIERWAQAALAKPPRNCDRFTDGGTARQAWLDDEENWDDFGNPKLELHQWLLAPAEERKGEGDGR